MAHKVVSIPDRGASLDLTLDCGQCFHWLKNPDDTFTGVISKKMILLWKEGNTICAKGDITEVELEDYFDITTDYTMLKELFYKDAQLRNACEYAPGIRILKQDSWVALVSFILSQNNNIGRIKGLVKRLCEQFGDEIAEGVYSFPPPERLCNLTPEDITEVRSGFRARYLIDAAQKVCSGEVDLESAKILPLPQAQEMLMKIKGVGIKVANCTLLYGCHRLDAFPVDVWIKRAMEWYFPQGLAEEILPYAGVAQQFIFHYIRTSPDAEGYRIQSKKSPISE